MYGIILLEITQACNDLNVSSSWAAVGACTSGMFGLEMAIIMILIAFALMTLFGNMNAGVWWLGAALLFAGLAMVAAIDAMLAAVVLVVVVIGMFFMYLFIKKMFDK